MGLKEDWAKSVLLFESLKSKGPNAEKKHVASLAKSYSKLKPGEEKNLYLTDICWFIKNGIPNSQKLAIESLQNAKIKVDNHVLTTIPEIKNFAQQILNGMDIEITNTELMSAPPVDVDVDITLAPINFEDEKGHKEFRKLISKLAPCKQNIVIEDTLRKMSQDPDADTQRKALDALKIFLEPEIACNGIRAKALALLKELQLPKDSSQAKINETTQLPTTQTEQKNSSSDSNKKSLSAESKSKTNKSPKKTKQFKPAPPKIKIEKSEDEKKAEDERVAKEREARRKEEAEQETKRRQRAEEEEKIRSAQSEKRKAAKALQDTTAKLHEILQDNIAEEKAAQAKYDAQQKKLEKLAFKQKTQEEIDFWEGGFLKKNEYADVMLVNARQHALALTNLPLKILTAKMNKIISMIGYARAISYYKEIFKDCERIHSTQNKSYSDREKELMEQLETLKPIGFIAPPENASESKISPEEIADNRVIDNPALYPEFLEEEKTPHAENHPKDHQKSTEVFKFNAQVKPFVPSSVLAKQPVDPKQNPISLEIKAEVVEEFIVELGEVLKTLSDNDEDIFLGGGSAANAYFKSKNPHRRVSYNDWDIRMIGCDQNKLAAQIQNCKKLNGLIIDFENITNTYHPIIRFKIYDGKLWQKIEIAFYQKEKGQTSEDILLKKLYSFGDTNISSLILNLTKRNQNNNFALTGSADSLNSLKQRLFKIINKNGGQTVFRNDVRCMLRHILKEEAFPELRNDNELKLLLDGYAINALTQAAFNQLTPDELKKPYLIQQEDGSHYLWGSKNNQWTLTNLGYLNIKLELTLSVVQTLFIENKSVLLDILKTGHYFIQSRDSIASICFNELHTDRLQQKRVATFFIDTLFARYDFLTAINLLNEHHHIFVKLTDTNFKNFKLLEPLLKAEPSINADPTTKALVFSVMTLLSYCGDLALQHQYSDPIEREKILWDKLINWHLYGTLHEMVKPAQQSLLRSIIETIFKETVPGMCFESLVSPIFSRYLSGNLKSLPKCSAETLGYTTPSHYQLTTFTPQSPKNVATPQSATVVIHSDPKLVFS